MYRTVEDGVYWRINLDGIRMGVRHGNLWRVYLHSLSPVSDLNSRETSAVRITLIRGLWNFNEGVNVMSVFVPAWTISACPTLAPRYVIRRASGGEVLQSAKKARGTFAVIRIGKLIKLTSATVDVAILAECIQYNWERRCFLSGVFLRKLPKFPCGCCNLHSFFFNLPHKSHEVLKQGNVGASDRAWFAVSKFSCIVFRRECNFSCQR